MTWNGIMLIKSFPAVELAILAQGLATLYLEFGAIKGRSTANTSSVMSTSISIAPQQ